MKYFLYTDTKPTKDLKRKLKSIPQFMPDKGVGYVQLQKGHVSMLMDEGALNANAIALSNILYVHENASKIKPVGVICVDNGTQAVLSVKAAKETLALVTMALHDAAIGFNGKIASGTNGTSFTISKIKTIISAQAQSMGMSQDRLINIAMRAITYMLFNTYYIAPDRPSIPGVAPFYDFRSVDAFTNYLTRSIWDFIRLKDHLVAIHDHLFASVAIETHTCRTSVSYIIAKANTIVLLNPEGFLKQMKSQDVVGVKN